MDVCDVDTGTNSHILRLDDESLFALGGHQVCKPFADRVVKRRLEAVASLLHGFADELLDIGIDGDGGSHGVIICINIFCCQDDLRKGAGLETKNPAQLFRVGGVFEINLAIPTFALVGTIIGPESLTAVFGMGTGVSFPVWSPEEVRSAL